MLSRGNERKDIFRDDRERLTFLDVVAEMSNQYHVDIFAYTLMTGFFLGSMRTGMQKEPDLRTKYKHTYSPCKM